VADRENDRKMHSSLFNNGIVATSQKSWLRLCRGGLPALKSWGGPRFGSQHRGTCAPRLGVECEGPGYHLPPSPGKSLKT